MPRTADHDQRRDLMTRAFQRLLAAEGLHRVSFARVATEAGVSVGLIQHYFENKAALLRYSYEDCLQRSAGRVETRIRTGESARQPIAVILLDGLTELLPLDPERTLEFRVERSLWMLSLNDAELAAVAQRASADLQQRIAVAIDNGKECGEVSTAVDSDRSAAMILCAARGFADSLAMNPSLGDPGSIDAILRPVISLVFTGHCSHYST